VRTAELEKRTLSKVIRIDGEYRAARNAPGGVAISDGAAPFSDEVQTHGAADTVLGELIIRVNGDGDPEFDEQRRQFGLTVRSIAPGISRVCTAFARFTVVKSYDALPSGLSVRRVGLSNYTSVYGICPDPTEQALLQHAIQLDAKTCKRDYSLDGDSFLLITDKVFVAACARRCGISEYIHTNLADIAHVFIGAHPKLVVLNCGDFSNEHTRLGMSEPEYKDMLRTHYMRVGYEPVDSEPSYVLYKLL
jgi:hypothetical protein